MDFKDLLNKYLEDLDCKCSELSKKSGLSQTVISRYKNGERIPSLESEHLKKLVTGIYMISKEKKMGIDIDQINNSFFNSIKDNSFDFDTFSKKFDKLISGLKISIVEISKFINFDSSFISRIRTGSRKPASLEDFVNKVCSFVTNKYTSTDNIHLLADIIECDVKLLVDNDIIYEKLKLWLIDSNDLPKNNIGGFLKHLDEFDLKDYIKSIKFDELKIPSVQFYIVKTRTYYGVEEMKLGELDFFKGTVLGKSKDDIFMCSDMPMEDMAKDINFGRKWMFGIAMCLKKGLHLNIIHNLDRPFNEMMLGLESWIPIYMTGQVSPYYLRNNKDIIYCHLNYSSGNAVLNGECIKGYHDMGKYYLTNNKKEMEYYDSKIKLLFKKANSLMDIYKEDSKASFNSFKDDCQFIEGNRHRILSSLPLFTINDKLLISILIRNNVFKDDIKMILAYKHKEVIRTNNILKNNNIIDEINDISKENFSDNKMTLALEGLFFDKKIIYTYDEYKQHLESTKDFMRNNNNYSFKINKNNVFNNINITILKGEFVIISKNANPVIHFVIRHPKLRDAIENFSAPVK